MNRFHHSDEYIKHLFINKAKHIPYQNSCGLIKCDLEGVPYLIQDWDIDYGHPDYPIYVRLFNGVSMELPYNSFKCFHREGRCNISVINCMEDFLEELEWVCSRFIILIGDTK